MPSPSEVARTDAMVTVCNHCGNPIDVPVALVTVRRGGCRSNFPGSEYTADEVEFLRAIEHYKVTRHRPHPTWTEIYDIFIGLGYRKPVTAE